MGSWWNWRTSSAKLLWYLILLSMAVSLLIIGATKKSNWTGTGSTSVITSYSSSSSNSVITKDDVIDNHGGGSTVAAEAPGPFAWRSAAVESGGGVIATEGLSPLDDYVFNQTTDSNSSYPPLAMEDELKQLPKTISALNKTDIFVTTNKTPALPTGKKVKRKCTALDKLEASLMQVRATIREAKSVNRTFDPDFVPNGPMYWNAAVFHRSYLEMEKQFKVFVYEEGESPLFHNGPCKGPYASEGNFINQMETSRFRTRNPAKAHTFFLSMSATRIRSYIFEGIDPWNPMRQTVRDYVNLVASKYPFWNRSLGADHFTVACHDWGPELFKAVPYLFKNSIRALCNANTSEGFNPSKDVSIPEIRLPRDGSTRHILNGPSPRNRHVLAFFAGGIHGPIRPVLLKHWEDKDPDIQVHKYLPKDVSYMGMLRKSKYCISPSGYEVASPRMVESLYTGCVPVIIKDHYVAPFSDVLNWKSFAVILSVEEIPNLKNILTGISKKQYLTMQRRGKKVRRHFEVNHPPERYDVFHMILHSVWLRRINIQIQCVVDS